MLVHVQLKKFAASRVSSWFPVPWKQVYRSHTVHLQSQAHSYRHSRSRNRKWPVAGGHVTSRRRQQRSGHHRRRRDGKSATRWSLASEIIGAETVETPVRQDAEFEFNPFWNTVSAAAEAAEWCGRNGAIRRRDVRLYLWRTAVCRAEPLADQLAERCSNTTASEPDHVVVLKEHVTIRSTSNCE